MKIKSICFVGVLMCLTLASCGGNADDKTEEKEKYTISFNTNGGSAVNLIEAYEGDAITSPTSTKDCYSFAGWYTEEALTTLYEFTTMPAYNFELYAKWTAVVYTVTYHLNGGTNGVNPETYSIDGENSILQEPTKDYCVFKGWFTEESFVNQMVSIPNSYGKNLDLYAKWSEKYNITYHLNGGTNGDNPSEYQAYSGKVALKDPSYGDLTFLGWFTDDKFENQITAIDTNLNANIDLYAKFANGLVTSESSSGITIVAYAGYSINTVTELVIPNSINGKDVIEINKGALNGLSSLVSLSIPFIGSIKGEVGVNKDSNVLSYAFGNTKYDNSYQAAQPYSCTVNSGGTSMNYSNTFGYIPLSLREITITGETVLSKGCLSDLRYVESISLTNLTATSINEAAFYKCYNLRSIVINSTITSIAGFAFNECYRLTTVYNYSSLSVEAGSSENGNVAFYAVEVLKDPTTDHYLYAGDFLFYDNGTSCYLMGYKGDDVNIVTPDYTKEYSIYKYAFALANFESVVFSEKVTSIGSFAFMTNSNLKRVTISKNITLINSGAFSSDRELWEVWNLSSLTIVVGESGENGNAGFYAKAVYTTATDPSQVFVEGDFYFMNIGDKVKLILYAGADADVSLPKTHDSYILGTYAFYQNNYVKKIFIPSNVKELEDASIFNLFYLNSIILPNDIVIHSGAINASPVTSMIIPSGAIVEQNGILNMSKLETLYVRSIEYAKVMDASRGLSYVKKLYVTTDATEISSYVKSNYTKGGQEVYSDVTYDIYEN